jgi:hypothetical protein
LTQRAGFPPADAEVRDWLLQSKTKPDAFTRAAAFMCALFVNLYGRVRKIYEEIASVKGTVEPEERAAKFRELMTDGQTFSHHGEPRRQFFEEVLQLADKVCAAYPHHGRLVHFMSFPVMVPAAASYATAETDAAFTQAVV